MGIMPVHLGQFRSVGKYILNQEEHHRKQPFKAELIQLLRKHHVEYDERYLFEENFIA
jgi:hypothetical protein